LELEMIGKMTLQPVKGIRLAVSALMIAALPVQLSAQDISDAHVAAARGAISALNATDPFDNILPAAAEGLKGRLISNNPDLEDEISNIVDDETIAMVSRRGDLETEAARIYAAAFSEEDLNAIAEFYNTEAGQKLIQNGPIVAREVRSAAQIWARGIERDLLENVVAKMNEAGLRAVTDGAEGDGAVVEEQPAEDAQN
jgi:hypothetical protein